MELHFARDDLLNTVLRDAHGKPLYRIESPLKLVNRTTTVARILHAPEESTSGPSPSDLEERVTADNASDTDILLAGMEECVVAEITWQDFESSVFKFGEREVKVNEYLPAPGLMAKMMFRCGAEFADLPRLGC
jgi:hypothetical protein